eukprot:6035836-Prymnesium_polylepis.2
MSGHCAPVWYYSASHTHTLRHQRLGTRGSGLVDQAVERVGHDEVSDAVRVFEGRPHAVER